MSVSEFKGFIVFVDISCSQLSLHPFVSVQSDFVSVKCFAYYEGCHCLEGIMLLFSLTFMWVLSAARESDNQITMACCVCVATSSFVYCSSELAS